MTCCAVALDAGVPCCRPAIAPATRPAPVDWARLAEWAAITVLGVSAGLAGVWSLIARL